MSIVTEKNSHLRKVPALVRSIIVAPAIFALVRYAAGFWSQTERWFKPASSWISDHWGLTLLVILGCLALVIQKKFIELIYWAATCIGSWLKILGILNISIGIILAYRGFQTYHTAGPIWCIILLGSGLFLLFTSEDKLPAAKKDDYHRLHLVAQLAEFLLKTPPNIRRIGILAEWGEGKTHVMKMLEEHLRGSINNKFRMAWVNPWRANSHEEAWVEIAKGVDQALGFPRLLPHSILSIPGLGSLLALLPKPFSGFTADMKTLLTSHGSAADKIATGIAQYLQRRDQWLLIFIDDMERVGSDELRKIFPVVDRLVELERCFFIFAIDPKRIAKAFKEGSAHSDETKGYLDKILDFQLSLPMASRGEVLEMLQNRIDPEACPKLFAALPELKDYLPINPRLADRFLRDADGRERMFLSRFGSQEENYEGFFLLLILEVCFPLAHQQFKENLDDFDGITFLARKGMWGSDSAEDKKHEEFLGKVMTGLASHEMTPVKKLLDRLTHLAAHLLIFDEGQPALNFPWAFEGYRKLIRLSAADRLKLLEIWREQSGRKSIELMLKEVNEYDDKDFVVKEALKMELESIGNGFSHAYKVVRSGDDLVPLQVELEKRMTNFIAHASAISDGKMQNLDLMIFNDEMFNAWLEIAQNKPMRDLPDDFISALIPIRQKLTKSLAILLPPKKYNRWARRDIWSIIHLAEGSTKEVLKKEFLPVREEILNELTGEFADVLRHKRLSEESLPLWLEGSKLFDLGDATRWLVNAKDDKQPSLDALVKEAPGNAMLRENFAILIEKGILVIYENDPDDVLLSHSNARPCIEKHSWLLQKCWRGAWSGYLPEKTSDKLIELRAKAIAVERSLNERQQVDSTILDVLNELSIPNDPVVDPKPEDHRNIA